MEVIMFLLYAFVLLVLYPAFPYLLAPAIIALTRKKFKRKTLRIIVLINGICGFAFLVLRGVYTGKAAIPLYAVIGVLISFIVYAVLKRTSAVDYFKDGKKYLDYDPNRIVECKSCGYRSRKFFNACPKCGNYTKRYVYLNEDTAEYNYCCGSCGEKCSDGDNFCSKCGTKITQK